MATVKWIHAVFLVTLRLGLASSHRVLSDKYQEMYEPNKFGFQLGGTWSSPFLGNGGNVGGFLGFGSDGGDFSNPGFGFGGGGSFEGGSDGSPGFGFGGGGGGFGGGIDVHPGFGFSGGGGLGEGIDGCPGGGGGDATSGCRCECRKSGGGFLTAGDGSAFGGTGHNGDTSPQPWFGRGLNLGNGGGDGGNNGGQNIRIVKSLTCRPMECPSNDDCGGYGRCFDGSPPYWCDVPGFGVYPFWCPGGLDKSGQSTSCMPLSSPFGSASPDGYLGPSSLFRVNGHAGQQNGAGESRKADNKDAAGHN
eukprot:XP_015574554.1 glycine-rich cell wall structural protein 2 [Ricinus communis]